RIRKVKQMQAPGFSRPSPAGSPSPPFFAGLAVSQLENRPKQHHKLGGKDKCDEQTFHGQHLFSRNRSRQRRPASKNRPPCRTSPRETRTKLDFCCLRIRSPRLGIKATFTALL